MNILSCGCLLFVMVLVIAIVVATILGIWGDVLRGIMPGPRFSRPDGDAAGHPGRDPGLPPPEPPRDDNATS